MGCNAFDRESLVFETCVLTMVGGYALLVVILSAFNVLVAAALILLMAACAYGIPVSNTDGPHGRKFSVCAASMASLSFLTLLANAIVAVIYSDDRMYYNIGKSTAFLIGFIIGTVLSVVPIVLALMVAIKHIRNSRHIHENVTSRPMQITGPVGVEMHQPPYHPQNTTNYYNNRQDVQPLIGQPGYRAY